MSEREPSDFEYVFDALGDWVNERTPRRDVMIAFDALARIQAHVEALEGALREAEANAAEYHAAWSRAVLAVDPPNE